MPSKGGPGPGEPVGQQILEYGIEPHARRFPRFEQVVVESDLVDGSDGRVRIGVGGKQHAPGLRVDLDRFQEELRAGHVRHTLVHEKQRDLRPPLLELAGSLEGLGAGRRLDHAVIGPEMVPEVARDGVQDLRIVVDCQQNGLAHAG